MEKPTKKGVAPPMAWRTRLSILAAGCLTDATCRADGTINRRLLNFLDPHVPPSAAPRNGVASRDVVVDPAIPLRARLFYPCPSGGGGGTGDATKPLPVVVFFHGGGFAFLSAASRAYDAACRRIARYAGAAVLSVDYRRSPEHRYPTPYDDGLAALRFLDDRLAGLIAIQPFFGGEERTPAELRLVGAPIVSVPRTDWLWRAFLPPGADRTHEAAHAASPAGAAGIDSPAFPPATVVIGGYDPLQDWQRRYCETLRGKGKAVRVLDYPDAIHAFYIFPEFAEARDLMLRIKDIVAGGGGEH
uniref:Alpha/beta hydrolase fold-3 domain-containing protein n=1 Tax=Oryza nivara TaxID=4536 RepID=A0A0E0J048_ORYNI